MGNNFCAPWKKPYRDNRPWAPKKDSHLLRLWAEIFVVRTDAEGDLAWERVSDDVVPVNITCIQDSPETVFQITAYNRHVEKIFDVRLFQPGTRITQASECFVHWRDARHEYEWGLNFTTTLDARRFKDCCLSSTNRLSRKASSSGSLRLSPPKRVRGSNTVNKSNSEPASPVSKPRRAISTPEELSSNHANGCYDQIEHRVQHKHVPINHQTVSSIKRSPHPSGAQTLPKQFTSASGAVDAYQNRDTIEAERIYGSRERVAETEPEEEEDPYSTAAERKFSALDVEAEPPPAPAPNSVRKSKSVSSSEIEWPPPPEPIEHLTSPPVDSFDSATLKRMLRTLDENNENQNGDGRPPKAPEKHKENTRRSSRQMQRSSVSSKQFGSGSDTTELSESEDGSATNTSDSGSLNTLPAEQAAMWSSKSAAVRKAGWLHAKNWLIHKKRRVELARKRVWKKYWVCLKGTALLFMNDPDETSPKYVIIIESGMSQPVPEHPKRENIIALTTAFGDAYLFQATSQVEQENWICALHSACASCLARQHGKENTLKLLKSEIQKLESSIEIDIKMKKMADMKLESVSDAKTRSAIERQIAQWDEDLEKLYMEQYRLKCYIASLHGNELPNPKNLLSSVSKPTKTALLRLGICTVSTLHALVCARAPATAATLNLQRKGGLLSTFKSDVTSRIRPRSPRQMDDEEYVVDLSRRMLDESQSPDSEISVKSELRVGIPGGQYILATVGDRTTIGELLDAICSRRQLDPTEHFVKITTISGSEVTLDRQNVLDLESIESMQVCQKLIFQIDLFHTEKDGDFGMNVEAELADETDDELRVFISEISRTGVAGRKGLMIGDEILVLNGRIIAKLDMVYVENILNEECKISLTIRSCRIDLPASINAQQQQSAAFIEQIVIPPPPYQSIISERELGELILPAPESKKGSDVQKTPEDASVDSLLQGAEQVTHFCRLLHSKHGERVEIDGGAPSDDSNGKQLTEGDRLRKVVKELISTERLYVRDLNCLIERYLEPLKDETFLTSDDVEQLFGNIREIVSFQKIFLNALEEGVRLEQNFDIFQDGVQFKKLLLSLAGTFLYHANHFKLYSSFCASHSKAQKILQPDSNPRLADFLRARNPKQQHSSTLESFLIKPIQRILKYPLLLAELRTLTRPNSEEYQHLDEALRCMQAVAEHINEMQKIHEEYGCVFDSLVKEYKLDLNIADLHMYGNVNWLNALEDVRKVKKGTDLLNIVFVFKQALVLLCQERTQRKRSPKSRQQPPPGPGTEGMEIVKFRTAIPVEELQVRATGVGDTERHGLWTAVHCRSEQEGRPEKRYEFASSLNAKAEFLKTIRNTIRDSVKRMSVPSTRRPDSLSSKRKTVARFDMSRSLDMEERSAASDSDSSARLMYSSHRPVKKATPKTTDTLGSPVWKPRTTPTYTDYASVQEQRQRRVTLKAKAPSGVYAEDTDC